MPLLLPNLDDRNWAELVDEGRSLIPVYGPEWTDHNASDPGITLIELLAWFAEMDIYELNQISDRERLKFLHLLGITPQPPSPAQALLRITLANGSPLNVPAGLEFLAQAATTISPRFRTLAAVTLAPGTLEALQFRDATGFHDVTPAWRRGTALNPFGLGPQPGIEFYVGVSAPLPPNAGVPFYFTFADGRSGCNERTRILCEAQARDKDCLPPANPCVKGTPGKEVPGQRPSPNPLQHHGVRTVWEFSIESGGALHWQPLDPARREVEDNTRAFTLDGTVTFRLPASIAAAPVGAVSRALYYLRCRVTAGSYDAAPAAQDISFNGVRAEQSVPAGMSFIVDPGAHITYNSSQPPKPNDVIPLIMALDAKGRIVGLTFGGDPSENPSFRICDFRAPAGGAAGLLAIEAVFLGFGTGLPNQQRNLPGAPVKQCSVELFTLEGNAWRHWKPVRDFDASTRKDFHFALDAGAGTVRFGTGENARVPPGPTMNGASPREQSLIFATYETTLADVSNIPASAINQLADSPHNRAALYDPAALPDGWTKFKAQLKNITNPLPATWGATEETVAQASGRADRLVRSSDRAVTLEDYERLAMQTPGTRIARVSARANLYPALPCCNAPGMVTVIVLPFLPQGRPAPSRGLLQSVRAYLRRRRIVGTRVEVTGPNYLDLSVQAQVQALAGANKLKLRDALVSALNKFLDPLQGGPDGSGWPFGRDVYRSEIMRIIDEVPGVDYVSALALIAGNGQPQCGNVCVGPTWLVAAGQHQITVL